MTDTLAGPGKSIPLDDPNVEFVELAAVPVSAAVQRRTRSAATVADYAENHANARLELTVPDGQDWLYFAALVGAAGRDVRPCWELHVLTWPNGAEVHVKPLPE